MRLKDENPELNGIVESYNLRGFSFREYLNLLTGSNLPIYSLDDISRVICTTDFTRSSLNIATLRRIC